MRYLAIDLGGKRTGLAVGDDETGSAGPVDVIVTGDASQRLVMLRRAIERYAPDALVIGLPLNMDGTKGPAAQAAEQLAATLGAETGLIVHRVDERLTSYQADDQMKQTGLTHGQKKARRDALAAAAILRDFLEGR